MMVLGGNRSLEISGRFGGRWVGARRVARALKSLLATVVCIAVPLGCERESHPEAAPFLGTWRWCLADSVADGRARVVQTVRDNARRDRTLAALDQCLTASSPPPAYSIRLLPDRSAEYLEERPSGVASFHGTWSYDDQRTVTIRLEVGADRNISPKQVWYWTGDALLYLLNFGGEVVPMPLRRADGRAIERDVGGKVFSIRDPEGGGVAGASVILWQRKDHLGLSRATALGVTGKDGQVAIALPDPAKDLEIEVIPPDSRADLAAYGPRPWDGVASAFTLNPGFAVSGHIVDGGGRPVAGARVWVGALGGSTRASTEDIVQRGHLADASGRFQFPHLPVGRVVVWAGLERGVGLGYVTTGIVNPSSPSIRLALAKVDVGNAIRAAVDGLPVGASVYLLPPDDHLPRVSVVGELPSSPPGVVVADRLREAGLSMLQPWLLPVDTAGEVLLPLLPSEPERLLWTLWIPGGANADGRCVLQPEAGLAASLGPIPWTPSGVVRGRASGVLPFVEALVDVLGPGGYPLPGTVGTDASFEVRGVPPGRWPLRLRVLGNDLQWRRYGQAVSSGEEVSVVKLK